MMIPGGETEWYLEMKTSDVVMQFKVERTGFQAGARLKFQKVRKWSFEKWADGPELSSEPKDWLNKHIPDWVRRIAVDEYGELFLDRIESVARRVLILAPDPIFASHLSTQDPLECFKYRQACVSMKERAHHPIDIKCLRDNESTIKLKLFEAKAEDFNY